MIYIDSNEISHHPELKDKLENIEIRNQNVDYIINGCSIEVKWNLDDFYASVIDKRLWRQAKYLIENNGFFILINQSSYYFKKNYRKKMAICEGAIISLLVDWRILILILESEGALYNYLQKIAEKLSKEKKNTLYANFKKIGSSDRDRHLGTLAQIEGISVTKAQILFEEFDSLKEIMQKKTENFAKIKGFGPKLSKRIVEFFNWKWK